MKLRFPYTVFHSRLHKAHTQCSSTLLHPSLLFTFYGIYSRANNNWDYKGLEIFITHS